MLVATRIDDRFSGANVDDPLHDDAGPLQVGRDEIGAVVVREDHRPRSGRHPVSVDVRSGRAREHDARPVVVRKDQWPLVGPGRNHDAFRPDLPEAAAAGPALRDQDQVLVVVAKGRRAPDEPDVRL